jgi:hypothetical protein
MTTLIAKFVTDRTTATRQISEFAVVALFSLVGLVVALIAARYGMDVSGGVS